MGCPIQLLHMQYKTNNLRVSAQCLIKIGQKDYERKKMKIYAVR